MQPFFLERYTPQLLGLLRIVSGLLFVSHGLLKMFGFPPGVPPGAVSLFTLPGASGRSS